MKFAKLLLSVLAAGSALSAYAEGGHGESQAQKAPATHNAKSAAPHWGYSGHEGPEHWGDLDPSYAMCSKGKNQSPINLTNFTEGDLPAIAINYKKGGREVYNNGHTIQVNYAPGSTISIDGKTFELKQFHFHSPSENTIESHSYPMEAHFVHADNSGNLAVIAVMYKEGSENQELAKAWRNMPQTAGEKNSIADEVNALTMLPENRDYYRFTGSLTTPPCSEGVRWLVMKYFDTASAEQIKKFTSTMRTDNNRPVQPVNARLVVQ